MTSVIGIDEAGRGPALGDMVLAGVKFDIKRINVLHNLNVRDSKTYGSSRKAQQKRCAIAQQIFRSAKVKIVVVPVQEIDSVNLNTLELRAARQIIKSLDPSNSDIFLDGHSLFNPLTGEFERVYAINKADSTIEVVAAASIVAKHVRDCIWRKIMRKYQPEFGEIKGNGYGKHATGFIQRYYNRYGKLPPETRKSWKSVKKIFEVRL